MKPNVTGAALLSVALALTTLSGSAQAASPGAETTADTSVDTQLFDTVKAVITAENQLTLDSGHASSVAESNKTVKATAKATKKLGKRRTLKAGVRESNQAAGVSFSSVESSYVLKEVRETSDGRTVLVDEVTRYPMVDGQDYEYRVEHRAAFTRSIDGWTLVDVSTDSPTSEVGEAALAAAGEDAPGHVAAGVGRVRQAKAALDRNRHVLKAVDDTKAADRSVALADEVSSDPTSLQPAADPGASELARPTNSPARLSAKGLAVGPGSAAGDGIPPYEYSAMVTWAKWYAKDHPVTYTRDTNDCTTFVSWAMWKGGWAEVGAEDYPSVLWNRDDDNAWYWRCNTCDPRHSYTWGGAANWYRFAYYQTGRVRHLGYLTDLGANADVMQMEVDGYGSTDNADHTMLTTGRNSAGWVLLSYHSTDTLNKPLNLVLSSNNGPYWAWRT